MFGRKPPKLYPEGKNLFGIDLASREQAFLNEVWERQNKPYKTRWGTIEIGKAYFLSSYEPVACRYIISFPVFLNGELRLTAHAAISGFTDNLMWDLEGAIPNRCQSGGGHGGFDDQLDRFFEVYGFN